MIRAGRAIAAVGVCACLWPRWAAAASGPAEQAVAEAQRAQKDGRSAKAAEAYRRFVAEAPNDERAPWALTQVGDLEAQAGHVSEALAAYGRVLKAYPDSIDARLARSRLNDLAATALAAAHERAQSAGTEEERMQAAWEVGTIHEWNGDLPSAAAAFRDLKASASSPKWKAKAREKLTAIVEARIKAASAGPPVPDGQRWAEIAALAEAAEMWDRAAEYDLRLADLTQDPDAKARARLAAARALTLGGRTDRALAIYRDVGRTAKGEALDEAARGAGLAYENARRWKDALRVYEGYLRAAGDGEGGAWAVLRRASCEERIGAEEAAVRDYHLVAERFPKRPEAAEALLAIGRLAEDKRDFDSAKVAYAQAADGFAGTPKGAEAKAKLMTLPSRVAAWERQREQIVKMGDTYAKRERKDE